MHLSTLSLLWLLFILGQLINVLKRAGFAVRGPNAVKSRTQFLILNWDVLLIRGAGGAVLFWLWAAYPDLLTTLAGKFNVTINLTIPVLPPTAFIFGLAVDVVLDWVTEKIPALRNQVPSINGGGNAAPTP